MLDEQDKQFLGAAEAALTSAWDGYHAAPDSQKLLLYPQVELAYTRWLDVRMKLLKPGTMSDKEDVDEARRIHQEIDKAADNQQLVMGVVRLVGLLAKFA